MALTYDIIQYSGLAIGHSVQSPYQIGHIPQWDGTGARPTPNVANNKGYDVRATTYPEAVRQRYYQRANATICNDSFKWPMFITDVSIDNSLNGATAQSRTTRDFYPKNFVQPSFVIRGISLDQRDYGDLTDFVHYLQYECVTNAKLAQIYVDGGGFNNKRQGTAHAFNVVANGVVHTNQAMRGGHAPLLCLGYVGSIDRIHTQYVYAPTYTFNFVVAEMVQGPWQESMVQVTQQQNWIDIVKGTKTLTVNSQLMKQNNNVLKFAANNSSNVISSSGG